MTRARRRPPAWAALACACAIAACGGPGQGASGPGTRSAWPAPLAPASASPPAGPAPGSPAGPAAAVPVPAHVVVVVMENHAYGDIIGNPAAPFINSLARQGALFTVSFGVTHPSEPNYLALFSGATHGIADDSCPHALGAPNLAADLVAAGKSFTGYAEGLSAAGSPACGSGEYARKHVPWADFTNVPAAASQPFSAFPATDLAALPTVSWVIPDMCHDMHDCDVATGDGWLADHLGGYARWAMIHRSLLIVTWDEDDGSAFNHIPTIFVGQFVRPGRYARPITHYNVLATIEEAYGLRPDGLAAAAGPVTGIWSAGASGSPGSRLGRAG